MKNWNEMNEAEQREVCKTCPYYFGELDDCMLDEVYPDVPLCAVLDNACAVYKITTNKEYSGCKPRPKLYRVTAILNDVEFSQGEEWTEDVLANTADEAVLELKLKLSERRISIDYISVELMF